MKNLDDRLALKNVLLDVFFNLYEHSENSYRHLEDRVFAESSYFAGNYDIYTTVSARADIDPVHYFLRPVLEEDLTEQHIDLENIAHLIGHKDNFPAGQPLFKIFLNCDYQIINQIIEQQFFKGEIITETGAVDVVFSLRPAKSYLNRIKQLYETFIDNNIPWKTLNNPYIFRFFEVFLEKCDHTLPAGQSVKRVDIDLGQYNQYVCYDMVPLWNIEQLKLKSVGFPMPCKDKINFEHNIYLEGEGTEHGYLAVFSETQVSYIRRTKQALTVVAPTEQQDVWDVVKIIKPHRTKTERYKYPLLSNSNRQTFSNLMAQKSPRAIRTQAEIRHLVNSFLAAEKLSLSHIEIVPRSVSQPQPESPCHSYEANAFLVDEIRRSDYQNILRLYFSTVDKTDFLIKDQMSFVVSEIQLHYPEYKCEGIIS